MKTPSIEYVIGELVLQMIKQSAGNTEKLTEFAKWCIEQSIQAHLAVKSPEDYELASASELLVKAAHILLHKDLSSAAEQIFNGELGDN